MTFDKTGIPILGMRFFAYRNFSAAQIPDCSGKIAVITGGTSGIGLECARQLASHGADVIILGSSESNGSRAIATIEASTGKTVRWVHLNLSSITGAKKAAAEIKKLVPRIDILLANAGISSGTSLSEDGYEIQFATNHLGHFAFVTPLIPLLSGTDVRVVVTSSSSHYGAKPIPYDKLRDSPPKDSVKFGDLIADGNRRYEVSKLANVLFSRALQRRVPDSVHVCVLHPGVIKTNIQEGMEHAFTSLGWMRGVATRLFRFIFIDLGMSIPDGALTQLFCATSPIPKEKNFRGQYLGPIAQIDRSSLIAENTDAQEELWAWSEKAIR